MAFKINEDCVGCGYCGDVCPVDAIHREDKVLVIEPEKCVECEECVEQCPLACIFLDAPADAPQAEVTGINGVAEIIAEKCIGCSLCKKVCPEGAISGVVKQPFTVDPEKCTGCGACIAKCKKDAIVVR